MNCEPAIILPSRTPRLPWLPIVEKARRRHKPRIVGDLSGNLKLKNISNPTASTNGPSTTSNTYAVIPEMTTTITTKGNKVWVNFTSDFTDGSGGTLAEGEIAIFKDGSQLTTDFRVDVSAVASTVQVFLVSLAFIDSPTAASHTYDVRYKLVGTSGSFQAVLVARTLQVVELG